MEKYTNSILNEKDKIVLSNDAYAISEFLEKLNHTIVLLNNLIARYR